MEGPAGPAEPTGAAGGPAPLPSLDDARRCIAKYRESHMSIVCYDGGELAEDELPTEAGDARPLSERWMKRILPENPSKDAITHTFFAGGKAYVDDGKLDKLLGVYAIDILRAKTRLRAHMVERYIPTSFPFFVDVDMVVTQEQEDVEAMHRRYWDTVAATVQTFFPGIARCDERFAFIICARPPMHLTPKERVKAGIAGSDVTAIKYGYHLHWPSLIVNTDGAHMIRESIITDMWNAYSYRTGPGENSWEDVIDGSVYNNSGLRSIGSYKLKLQASVMEHMQKVGNECVTYWPHLALRGDGEPHAEYTALIAETTPMRADGFRGPRRTLTLREVYSDPPEETVAFVRGMMALCLLTRVRANRAPTEGYKIPMGAPRPVTKKLTGRTYRELRHADGAPTLPRGLSFYRSLQRDRDAFMRLARDAIRRAGVYDAQAGAMRCWWDEIDVADVLVKRAPARNGKRAAAPREVLVCVRGRGSSFCLNLEAEGSAGTRRGADHKNNHIFFFLSLDPPHLVQRCHCKCVGSYDHRYAGPGAHPVYCKDFTSAMTSAVAFQLEFVDGLRAQLMQLDETRCAPCKRPRAEGESMLAGV